MDLFICQEPVLPSATNFSLHGTSVALVSSACVKVLPLSGQSENSIPMSEDVRQVYLTSDTLYILSTALSTYSRPNYAFQLTFQHTENARFFAVTETHLIAIRDARVIILSLNDYTVIQEFEAQIQPRLVFGTETSVLLLQADYDISFMRFSGGEIARIPLTSRVVKLFLDRLPDAVHLPHLKGFLVTRDNETGLVSYDGIMVKSSPVVRWRDRPVFVGFLFPGYIAGVTKDGDIDLALFVTGKVISTVKGLKTTSGLANSGNLMLIHDMKRWVTVTGPSLETTVRFLIHQGEYETALALNEQASGPFAGKIYLEQALQAFFRIRDYGQASYLFHKSGKHWIPCLFFKHSVKVEKNILVFSEPYFREARSELGLTNVPESISALISEDRSVFEDDDLMVRAQQAFYPYFQSLREMKNEAQRFAEIWLFQTSLKLAGLKEKLSDLLTSENLLPIKHCEKALIRSEKFDLLYKMYLSKKTYQPPLELMKANYSKTGELKWLTDMCIFLCKMQKDEETFLRFLTFLFEVNFRLASELLTRDKPVILRKVDLTGKLLPMLRALGDNRIAIDLLSSAPEASQEQHNELAHLLIKEVEIGHLQVKSLTDYLSKEPYLYDPKFVLSHLPTTLQKERCILLDRLQKYDEVGFI